MSTLRVDNFQASDGVSPAFAAAGIAKATYSYNQVTPVVEASNNISSITDQAAGDHTWSLTNAFTDAFWSLTGSADVRIYASKNTTVARSASAWGAVVFNDVGTAGDAVSTAAMFGDLA